MTTPEGTSMAARAQAAQAERQRVTEANELHAAGLARFGPVFSNTYLKCRDMARASGVVFQPRDKGTGMPIEIELLVVKMAFEWCDDLRRVMGLSTSDEQAAGPGTEWVERPQQLRFNLSEHQQAALWPEGENYH